MSREDLIPITTTARAKEIGSLGGKKITPAKSLAAKLRELKKKGLTDENAQRIYELMTNPEMAELDILVLLEGMRKNANTVSEKREAAKLYI